MSKPRVRVNPDGSVQLVKRGYTAAGLDRLVSSWSQSLTDPNFDLQDLNVLQARSREEYKNNELVKRFVGLAKSNVIGPDGVTLQVKSMTARKELDTPLNNAVESQWRSWCSKGTCDVTGKFHFNDIANLVLAGLLIDGEVLIRRVRGWRRNPWGYAIQLIDVGRLSPKFTDEKRRITMSIQTDEWGAPVNYWLAARKKSDLNIPFVNMRPEDFDKIPATEMLHIYVPEMVGQDRGVPALAVSLKNLHMLNGYKEAELVAARQHANQIGFFERDTDGVAPFTGDATDDIGNPLADSEPGEWRELPAGMRANWIDPTHPNDAFPHFMKAMLRGIASGWGINYNSLSNDLEGVNFSSLRQGSLDERDTWMCMQNFIKTHFLNTVYRDWLEMSLENQMIPTGGRPVEDQRDKLLKVEWQPRRWAWVDPLKSEQANTQAINNRSTSVSQIIREQGRNPEDVFDEIRREREKMAELGITPAQALAATPSQEEEETTDG